MQRLQPHAQVDADVVASRLAEEGRYPEERLVALDAEVVAQHREVDGGLSERELRLQEVQPVQPLALGHLQRDSEVQAHAVLSRLVTGPQRAPRAAQPDAP